MTLGVRIEERLKALGMSQAELARRAKVPQTTMNGLIRGKSRTTPHLIRIARELQTTPAYLTEATDDAFGEFSEFVLTAGEREWIDMLRVMSDKNRKAVLAMARIAVAASRVES